MITLATDIHQAFDWQPQPEAAAVVEEIVAGFVERCAAAGELARRLTRETGTRLIDWIDHIAVPSDEDLAHRLAEVGFTSSGGWPNQWEHPGGQFPPIQIQDQPVWRLAIRVESVADFLAAHTIDHETRIEGMPLAPLRRAKVFADQRAELWVVERHGETGWEPDDIALSEAGAVLWHYETFWRRRRRFERPEAGFQRTLELIHAARRDLGVNRTCDLFFAAEREYWTRRNRAASLQKARQDALGLGWGNHDHHTYRSSREHFARLIEVLEQLGCVGRERFYAGREAGWGAQILEQSAAGIVIFADVDLGAEEVAGDFAHQPMSAGGQYGTVGVWCKLHGEAMLEAGLHHLECRYDFAAACRQLRDAGIAVMKPFSDLPYLKQAFTEGEVWPVDSERIDAALRAGAINAEAAERFRRSGAIGSHLEILQRDEGYKGFSKAGVSEIIRATDPRLLAVGG